LAVIGETLGWIITTVGLVPFLAGVVNVCHRNVHPHALQWQGHLAGGPREMSTESAPSSASDIPECVPSPIGSMSLPFRRLLVVTAHPDDESFALGGVLSAFGAQGVHASVPCFTHGERSTLGADCADLPVQRCKEPRAAAGVLGTDDIALLAYPDGRLAEVAIDELVDHILQRAVKADELLAFDDGGVTGHPGHHRATDAATIGRNTVRVSWYEPRQVQ
jgi:hypothetical protein